MSAKLNKVVITCAVTGSIQRLDGHALLPKLILGVKFSDEIEVARKMATPQSAIAA